MKMMMETCRAYLPNKISVNNMNNLRFFVVCSRRFNCGRSVDALTQQVDTGDVNATTADFVLLLPHSFVTLMRRMMMLLSYHCVIFLSFWQKRFLIWGSKWVEVGKRCSMIKGTTNFKKRVANAPSIQPMSC